MFIEKIAVELTKLIKRAKDEELDIGSAVWKRLIGLHPADIADILQQFYGDDQIDLFMKLPLEVANNAFEEMEHEFQKPILIKIPSDRASQLLRAMPSTVLTQIFDQLPDDKLSKYMKLLQKKQRKHVMAALKSERQSAGRITDSEIISLRSEFTVKKSVSLLQRLGNDPCVPPHIYVTNEDSELIGHIEIRDLVQHSPDTKLAHIMKKNDYIATMNIDQEVVAAQLHHYSLPSVPVVDEQNHFIGAITATAVSEVMEDETTEDMYKISGMAATETSYFHRPLWKLVQQRIFWLAGLLLLQSVSSLIISQYDNLLQSNILLSFFITMLIGTGGNAGNQSATLVVRGLATGEFTRKNQFFLVLREVGVAFSLGIILFFFGVIRVYLSHFDMWSALVISSALLAIVVTSVIMGTLIPLILDRLGIDPTHSAAPFLSTIMDVVGVTIYFAIAYRLLG
ncbi:magnesium transporter [bacterium]|nr:magnesium transporter [bacterium]